MLGLTTMQKIFYISAVLGSDLGGLRQIKVLQEGRVSMRSAGATKNLGSPSCGERIGLRFQEVPPEQTTTESVLCTVC